MPFTPVHVLAVIPVFWLFRRLSLTALAIGAMIPDFPMFFPVSSYQFSHSLIGVVVYCLPASLVVYGLFEYLGKSYAVDISPAWARARLARYRDERPALRPGNFLMLAVAFLIGSLSHLLWDAFTHSWGFGVAWFPALKLRVTVAGIALPWYKLLQYGFSIIGLPLLALMSLLYLKRFEPVLPTGDYSFSRRTVIVTIASFLCLPVVIAVYHWLDGAALFAIFSNTLKQSIGAGITLFFAFALLHRRRVSQALAD